MQTIETKYLGPTDHRGARIKATATHGASVTVPYPYELSESARHALAVRKLADKLDWTGEMIGGWTARGMVWTFTNKASPRITLPKWGLYDQGARAWLADGFDGLHLSNSSSAKVFRERRAALEYRDKLAKRKPDAHRLDAAHLTT